MGLVKYKPNSRLYADYYQLGHGFKGELFQKGYGIQSDIYQRGYGVGGNFKSRLRNSQIISKLKPLITNVINKSLPTFQKIGKKVGQHILDAGKESMDDLIFKNKKPKQIFNKQKENLKRKMLEVAQDAMQGRGKGARIENSESDSFSDDDEIERLIQKKSLRPRKRKRDIGIKEPVDIFGQAWH